MASLYKRGDVYWIRYELRGRLVRRSLRTGDRRLAQDSYERIIAGIRNNRLGLPDDRREPPLPELLAEHLLYCKTHLSPRTYRDRKLHIDKFISPFFGNIRVSDISPRQIEGFVAAMQEKGYEPRTINLRLETLRAALIRARDLGDIAALPCKIKKLKEPKSLPRYASMPHLREWMAYLPVPHRLRAVLSLCTGITDHDLGHVPRDGVDLDLRLILFNRSKTIKDIVVPLNDTAVQVAALILRDNAGPNLFPAASARNAYYRASQAYKAAGGINITPHMLRHTFATILLSQGSPMAFVRDLLGHADIETTQIYARVVPDYLRDAVSRISGPLVDLVDLLAAPVKRQDKRTDGRSERRWTPEQRAAQAERMKGNKRSVGNKSGGRPKSRRGQAGGPTRPKHTPVTHKKSRS